MNNTLAPMQCPKCGGLIPAEASQGLCPRCLLATIARPTEAEPGSSNRPPPPSVEAVQAALPQLEVLELIGWGGMGAVYRARQPKLDRVVALKVLVAPLPAAGAFAERFTREARVLARLNHPGVVSVFDYGEAGGFFYLLMEFVAGVNLRQAMQAQRFTPAQALALVPKICEALQYAHDEGILHRDIKPENILLDTRGRVKIADFGIAKLLGRAPEDAALTASGAAVGTPHYMAPEQLEHPRDVDQRADIYSLGVVFYEMLTGELPLGRFVPPSEKSSVDPRVDAVVLRALARERERRQQNATEVKQQLETISSTSPPASPLALSPKTDPCYVSTPEYLRTFRGKYLYIYQGKGELRLDRETLSFRTGWQVVTIPLAAIRTLAQGEYPAAAKPVPLHYIGVTFDDHGATRTLLFTPARSALRPVWDANAVVADWLAVLPDAIRAATGRALAVDRSATPPSWAWAELGKTFLVTTLTCTAAFVLIPVLLSQRLPNRWSELVWGPVTAALTMALLLAVRWWHQFSGAVVAPRLSVPPQVWERHWLALSGRVRQGARGALVLAILALGVVFLSFSSTESHEGGHTHADWSVGVFQPWLRHWDGPADSGAQGGWALNVATTSFGAGVAALLLGGLLARLSRIETASGGLPATAATPNPDRPDSGTTGGLGPSGTLLMAGPPPAGAAGAGAACGTTAPVAGTLPRATCYFSTPERMRNCFPAPAAHIFTCKGELQLAPEELVFVSPWRTELRLPLAAIGDLSIGQFQMWTTPWVMKYARLYFLSITFTSEGRARTVHLMPVAGDDSGPSVTVWFDRIKTAVTVRAGRAPHTSAPASVTFSAEPSWGRKGWPLFGGGLVALAACWWRLVSAPLTASTVILVTLAALLWGATLWFSLGFLQANSALKRGDFAAVTSDDPPEAGGPSTPLGLP